MLAPSILATFALNTILKIQHGVGLISYSRETFSMMYFISSINWSRYVLPYSRLLLEADPSPAPN